MKALGTLALALFAALSRPGGVGHYLLCAGVLTLATNAFNLIDLRPGRAVKALVILGAALTIGERGASTALGARRVRRSGARRRLLSLRERGMLGDTGATLLGALAGAWMVLTLSSPGLAIALALLAAVTVYGEFRSISALIESAPGSSPSRLTREST